MQNNYAGPAESFAMVVPVPEVLEEEDVKTLNKQVFDDLDRLSAPGPLDRSGNAVTGLRWPPDGTIAAVLPRNATSILVTTVLFQALLCGNRVVIRTSRRRRRTMQLYEQALATAAHALGIEPAWRFCCAEVEPFFRQAARGAELCHFVGSSRHLDSVAARLSSPGDRPPVDLVYDGHGNTLGVLAAGADIDRIADQLVTAATRFGGQTCTSLNGLLIERALYEPAREAIARAWDRLRVGDAHAPDTDLAPNQVWPTGVAEQLASIPADRIVRGADRTAPFLAALAPADLDSALVTDGHWSPGLWIAPFSTADELCAIEARNRYPFCLAGWGATERLTELFERMLARPRVQPTKLVINDDPSRESLVEPWGCRAPMGRNRVSHWFEKYLVPVVIQGPRDELADSGAPART